MRRPWLAAAVAVGNVIAAHSIHAVNHGDIYGYWFESTVGSSVFAGLGALILTRRRRNVIGWIFLSVGVLSSVQFLAGQYTVTGLERGWEGIGLTALVSRLVQFANVSGMLILLFLFPTGTLVSRRWKPVFSVAIVGVVVSVVIPAFSDRMQLEEYPGVHNPLAVESLEGLWSVLASLGGVLFFGSFVAALVGLVVRLRRSSGVERLQLKLFVYGAITAFVVILFGNTLAPARWDQQFGSIIWTVGPLMLPLSAGVAVLRYRLYDIDLVINRTLVYGSLTAILAALYVGLVFGLQALLAPVTAESDFAVAGSTLAVAAMFRPLRSRVQSFIDHRFYRRKFDAHRTLEEFNSHLRDEVDLAALSSRLETVVQETMQPTHVSLWLRTESP